MGDRFFRAEYGDAERRIAQLRAYLRGEEVRTAKNRRWPRGMEDIAREELRRLLGEPPRPTIKVMVGGETGEEPCALDRFLATTFDPGEALWLYTLCHAPAPEAP